MDNILDSTSFGSLDDVGQKAVRQLFDNPARAGKPFDNLLLFRQRRSLAISLDFYSKKLDSTNLASFIFLNRQQRTVLHQDLLFTFYLLSAQFQLTAQLNLDEGINQIKKLQELGDQIKRCARFISELRRTGEKKTPETILADNLDHSEKYLKYLGLTVVAPLILEGVLLDIREDADFVNGIRGQWNRTGALFSTIIAQLSDDFINKQRFKQKVMVPALIAGYVSWIMFYTHLAVDWCLLLSHTFRGPWMNQAEKDLPVSTRERFQTQWSQRKYSLIRNFNWGTAFMTCFFWLTGNGMFGHFGNALMIGFLLIDVCLTVWRFSEERALHQLDLDRFARDKAILNTKITAAKTQEEIQLLLLQLETITQAETKCNYDWKHKKYRLTNDLVYIIGLVIAFNMIFCFLFPPAMIPAALSLTLGFVGASLYFIHNLVYAAINNDLDVVKSRESQDLATIECKKRLEQFVALKFDKENDPDGLVKKRLYLEMLSLLAEADYQKRLAHFQTLQLVRTMLINTLAPSLMFVLYIFMPFGIGLGVLAGAIALAILSKKFLHEPKAENVSTLNETEYADFLHLSAPTLDDLRSNDTPLKIQSRYSFFSEPVADTKPLSNVLIESASDIAPGTIEG